MNFFIHVAITMWYKLLRIVSRINRISGLYEKDRWEKCMVKMLFQSWRQN